MQVTGPARAGREPPRFSREGLKFLTHLRKHNNRPWFQVRKQIYEQTVKAPMVELILALQQAFRGMAPEMVADPQVSLYRIYRDTRFSRDKSPYKTHAAAVFPVRGLPKNSGPSLYFHVSAEEVLIGGGMYMPEPAVLRAVREDIAAFPKKFLSIVEGKKFRKAFGELEGEQLRSMPKGFAADHAAAKYLRYKQFLFGEVHPPELALNPRLLKTILRCFQEGMPLIRFLKEPASRAAALSLQQDTLLSKPRLP